MGILTTLVTYRLVNQPKLIWWSGTRRFHLSAPNLQMSYRDFTWLKLSDKCHERQNFFMNTDLAFTWEKFHRDYPSYYSILYDAFEKYTFKIIATSPRVQWVNLPPKPVDWVVVLVELPKPPNPVPVPVLVVLPPNPPPNPPKPPEKNTSQDESQGTGESGNHYCCHKLLLITVK